MITILILLVALGVLIWGFNRARPYGKPGLLAWLQSVVLMAPWLLVFSLFTLGIFINLAAILVILVLSTVAYIYLGHRLRALGPDATAFRRPSAVASKDSGGQGDAIASSEAPSSGADTANSVPAIEKIPADDLQKIKEIFGVDTFFAVETIPYMDGAIFKGNLRGEADATHERLSERLQERMGDRYRLFLINDPTERPTVVILPSQNDPKPTTLTQKLFALVLGLATLATCFEAASILLGFDLSTEMARIPETLAIGGGLLGILAIHDIAHFWVAHHYQIRLSPPFFLPAWQLGSLGSLVRFESLLPNRKVLFDIAFAGPAAGGLLAFIFLIIGLSLSHQGGSQTGSLFPLQSEFFQGSILVGTMARIILGEAVQQPYLEVHPLVVVGWLGLIINAINLMPAGQLDGGRIVQAIYGRKVAGRTTAATLIILGIASLVNPLALYWAIVILFLQRDLERPALNELTEPDDARAAFALLALFLMAATLLPLTPGLSGRLGIGG